jgi:hypothetical protein
VSVVVSSARAKPTRLMRWPSPGSPRVPQLPPVRLTVGPAADLRALLDYREDLVTERGALVNRAHAELSGLRAGYQHQAPT